MTSPFLSPGVVTQENQLASLHLKRDLLLPTVLSTIPTSAEDTGYAEGVVTNTRFGSFPHSTLIGLSWGSQVRASQVDTGTRGRQDQRAGKKRKAEALSNGVEDGQEESPGPLKEAVAASSGFIHVLPPTPENWTVSLPHRTQVVYTPDYSYILHRIRARPDSVLIEAGSGSGSFTHAAARTVFDGYTPTHKLSMSSDGAKKKSKPGKVYTYEFHFERYKKVAQEMKAHGLDSVVQVTHRDVYSEGFLVSDVGSEIKLSPVANAVFLDLPAPWKALPHLTRKTADNEQSPLDPNCAVHICTFSPCIEQAQKTISALRRLGWLDIEMVEMQHKRIDVRREYTGLQYDGMRGVNAMAADVDEALAKLREVEKRAKDFHAGQDTKSTGHRQAMPPGKPQEAQKTLFKDGRLIHRSEPELKTHTSYLVFAILPREWTEEDEDRARAACLSGMSTSSTFPKSQRQLKREAKQRSRGRADEALQNSATVDGPAQETEVDRSEELN
jgi:tRNA (adenine57-N1/adenine58-N1)-methyltransferase catalytic subunit